MVQNQLIHSAPDHSMTPPNTARAWFAKASTALASLTSVTTDFADDFCRQLLQFV